MSIKFENKVSTIETKKGTVTITKHISTSYEVSYDEHFNEVCTHLDRIKRTSLMSITKQLEGCKYYVYCDIKTGVPVAMEHENYGEVGGLWFDKKKTLTDYDGCYCLPNEIIKTCRALGYHIPKDFEN